MSFKFSEFNSKLKIQNSTFFFSLTRTGGYAKNRAMIRLEKNLNGWWRRRAFRRPPLG
jgi:hypothetical protein